MQELVKHQLEIDQSLSDIFSHYDQIQTKRNQLASTGYINRNIAGECASLLPSTFSKRPINTYTITPSKTNLKFACESLDAGAWALIAAAVTALSVGGWHLYKYLAKKNNWPIPGATPSDPNPKNTPKSKEAVDESSEAAETAAEKSIEQTDDLLGKFLDANTKFNEILGMHDGLMEIKEESMIGPDNIKQQLLNRMGGKGAKVKIDIDFVNAKILPYMFPPTDIAYKVINRHDKDNPKNKLINLLAIKSGAWPSLTTKINYLKEEGAIFKKAGELIEQLCDFENGDGSNMRSAITELSQIKARLSSDKVKNKFVELHRYLDASIGKAQPMTLADMVKELNSDAYKNLYKTVQEVLFIGETAIFKHLGNLILSLNTLDEKLHSRVHDASKKRSGGQDGSAETLAEINKDSLAKILMPSIRTVRSLMSSIRELFTIVNPLVNFMNTINHTAGTIFRRLLEQLTKIYTDNGKNVGDLDKLSGELKEALNSKSIS